MGQKFQICRTHVASFGEQIFFLCALQRQPEISIGSAVTRMLSRCAALFQTCTLIQAAALKLLLYGTKQLPELVVSEQCAECCLIYTSHSDIRTTNLTLLYSRIAI